VLGRGQLWTLVIALMVAVLVPAATAQAATFTVTKTADTVPDGCSPSDCSLREAVAAANASAGNTVAIPAGTFVLNTAENAAAFGDLPINESMTIAGAGARSTIISGNGRSRVFRPNNDEATVTFNDLTVTGGVTPAVNPPLGFVESVPDEGGGIFTASSVVLNRVVLRNNTARLGGGGLMTEPPEIGFASTISVTADRTTVSDNSVQGGSSNGHGGGLLVFGNLTLTNSTVTGNSSRNGTANEGGGITATSGDLTFDSTVGEDSGNVTLTNVTIAGNSISGGATNFGGGLSGDNLFVFEGEEEEDLPIFYSDLRAKNTIIANNTVNGARQDCALVNTTSTDHNISSDATCGFGDGGSKQNIDPGLLPLENRGGPTDTMGLNATSAATNAGTNSGCPTIDQRGVARPQAITCDVGALELALPTAVTGAATSVKQTSATINGTAGNPHIDPGTAYFQYGTTLSYGQTTPAVPLAALSRVTARAASVSYSASLKGLTPGRVYHYRIGSTNRDGTAVGLDRTFRALRKPLATIAGVPRGCVRRAFRLRVRARVSRGTKVRSVRVRVDGKLVKRTSRSSFSLRVKPGRRAGRHRIEVRVTDRAGGSKVVRKAFMRCAARVAPQFTG
jgi:CSLREA domain-containing protein